MRLTWIGGVLPGLFLITMADLFDQSFSKKGQRKIWLFSGVIAGLGMTPWVIQKMVLYEPIVVVDMGPLEPVLRVGLIGLMFSIIWFSLRLFLRINSEKQSRQIIIFTGMVFYAVGGLFAVALYPLLGIYDYLELPSYGSVLWTSFAVWHVLRELKYKNELLSELDLMKRDLINHVTHEFRTPLNSIESAVDMLAEPTLHESKRNEYLEMIRKNTARLENFVDDLLDLALIQQAKMVLNKTETDLLILIERVTQRLKALAEKYNIKISISGPASSLFCDEKKMEQVITNVISNAIKAAPQGRIDIQISHTPEQMVISVSDNGVGIAGEHLKNIFSSFYHVTPQGSSHKGSGLGLAITKGIVEAHGGKIWAESKGPGTGSTFKIQLPLA